MPERTKEKEEIHIEPSVARRIRQILIRWGSKNYQDFPWREAKQPWHALIAEVLLQRTRAKNVVPVYLEFIDKYRKPDDLARAPVSEIELLIYSLGLKWRVPLIKDLGKILAIRNGKLPDNLEDLLSLPAIGPYAASAWLSFHGGKRSVIVDTNIVRFICRLTGNTMTGETRRKKWILEIANSITPIRTWKKYNYAILDFTMQICTKRPVCTSCPIEKELCFYSQNLYNED